MNEDRLVEAYEVWSRRQGREVDPEGKFDSAGRWFPSQNEYRECCASIRNPSRRFPYSLLVHCRTVRHVAKLFDVSEAELRRRIREDQPQCPRREGGDYYFKKVAFLPQSGKLVSIFDGTEYQIGIERAETARQGHRGGYYVYATEELARRATFPAGSKYAQAQDGSVRHVIIRCRVGGAYCRYPNGKLAFSRITPLEIVEIVE